MLQEVLMIRRVSTGPKESVMPQSAKRQPKESTKPNILKQVDKKIDESFKKRGLE